MKKLIFLISAGLLLAGTVSCGGKSGENTSDTGKTELVVYQTAGESAYSYLMNEKFGSISERYDIKETNYFIDSGLDLERAITNMNTDILSGKVPDIIITSPGVMDSLRQKGYLADLTPFLEGDTGASAGDFYPNVVESLRTDGEINALFTNYRLNTACAKSSFYGEELTDWSYKDAIAAYKSTPEGSDFLGSLDATFSEYFLSLLGRESIDLENNTCDFSGPFREALQFVSEAQKDGFEGYNDFDTFIHDHVLVYYSPVDGVNGWVYNFFYQFEGTGDLTFVGVPSVNGGGSFTNISAMVGIMSTSPRKEEAYEFISEMFSSDAQESIALSSGIPVIRDSAHAVTSGYYKYKAGSIYQPSPSHSGQGTFSISQEQIDQFLGYLDNVTFEPYYDTMLDDIIKEEYTAVLNGEKSADECVDMLNSRIGIYLSENS